MRPVSTIITVAASAAFVLSSTAAAASAPITSAQATAIQAQAPDAWMTLSMMSPASSIALGGASVGAQPTDVPPPPPPPEAGGALAEGWAPVAVLGLWAILIVAALATSGSSGASNVPITPPNSPA